MTYDITTKKKKKYVKHNTRPTSLQIYRFENALGESLPVFSYKIWFVIQHAKR